MEKSLSLKRLEVTQLMKKLPSSYGCHCHVHSRTLCYPRLLQSINQHPILYPPIYAWVSQMVPSLHVFWLQFCMDLSLLKYTIKPIIV